jgi:MFS family permease
MNNPADNPLRTLLSSRQFLWLLTGNTVMFFGFSGSTLLRSLLAWKLTQNEMALAYINLATAVCMFSSSFLSGAVIDRFERRRLMRSAQGVVLLAESCALLMLIFGQMTFPRLMLVAIVTSSTFPLIMPTRTAMLVDAVGRKPLGKASALMSGGVNIARMVSPAIMGVIAESGGPTYAYALLVFFHVSTQLCTLFLRPSYPSTRMRKGYLHESLAGFRYLFSNRPMTMCFVFAMLPILLTVPLQNLLIIFVEEVWHRGGASLGILMTAMGLGGLLGSALMVMLKGEGLVKRMAIAALAMSVFMLLFSNTGSFYFAVTLMLGISACSTLSHILVNTATQLIIEDHMRGRISSIMLMAFGLAPIGTLPLAYAAKGIGVAAAMSIAAVLAILAVLALWFAVPAFRQIDAAADLRRRQTEGLA